MYISVSIVRDNFFLLIHDRVREPADQTWRLPRCHCRDATAASNRLTAPTPVGTPDDRNGLRRFGRTTCARAAEWPDRVESRGRADPADHRPSRCVRSSCMGRRTLRAAIVDSHFTAGGRNCFLVASGGAGFSRPVFAPLAARRSDRRFSEPTERYHDSHAA